MNWFDRFRIAAFAASVSLLATFCVGGVEATYTLLLVLFGVFGVYVMQIELREIILRQLEIQGRKSQNTEARLDKTVMECRKLLEG